MLFLLSCILSFLPLSCGVLTPTPDSPVLGETAITDLQMQRTHFPDQNRRFEFHPCKAQLFELLSESYAAAGRMKIMLHVFRALLTRKLTTLSTSHRSHFNWDKEIFFLTLKKGNDKTIFLPLDFCWRDYISNKQSDIWWATMGVKVTPVNSKWGVLQIITDMALV